MDSLRNLGTAAWLAIDSIRAHKLRSFLTLLGIIIGVASVILVGAAIDGLGAYAEQITAKAEADLREAEQKVTLEASRVFVETEKLVAETLADGHKEAEQTIAGTTQMVAAVDKETAELEAQALIIAGEAKRWLEVAEANQIKVD